MELKVKVTKEILKKSMMCGVGFPSERLMTDKQKDYIGQNCAISLAVRDVFPYAFVGDYIYWPFGDTNPSELPIESTHNGSHFIKKFDNLRGHPSLRLHIPETEITLQITDEILNKLADDCPNWEEVVNASPVLELV